MALSNVTIIRLNGKITNASDNDEGIAALCMGGVAVSGGAALNTNYKFFSVKSAEALGLDADYDTTNNILVHHHISEFFRKNPTGELHVRLVAQGTTLAAMVDKANTHLKSLLAGGEGRIKYAGVVLNPLVSYTPTLTTGLDEDVLNAIPVAQALADDEYSVDRPINNIVIEGREFNGTVGSAADLRNLAGGPYRDVTVCIASDAAIADDHAIKNDYAAVGTYLGCITNKTASQSFAQPIEQFNLTDTAEGRFLSAHLSSNAALSTLDPADVSALNDKGYVFTRTFNGYAGVYFNQSSVCAPLDDIYLYSERRAVVNRAVRLVRPVMIPLINSTDFPITAAGRIQTPAAKSVEADVRTALAAMNSDMSYPASDVVNTKVIVDPAQDPNGDDYASFLSDPTLRVFIEFIYKGKAVQILVTIGQNVG